MRVGDLDRRITIQKRTTSQDTYGEPDETWNDWANVWASVKQRSGEERFESEKFNPQEQTVFKIRYIPSLTPEYRIKYDEEIYNIRWIEELGRKEAQNVYTEARIMESA